MDIGDALLASSALVTISLAGVNASVSCSTGTGVVGDSDWTACAVVANDASNGGGVVVDPTRVVVGDSGCAVVVVDKAGWEVSVCKFCSLYSMLDFVSC